MDAEIKLIRLKILWIVLQITQFLYIGSYWAVVRGYFSTSLFEEVEELEPDVDQIDLFCEKSTEVFGLMWFSFVSFLTTVSLILVLNHHRSKTALGFFIGVSATMANWTLVYAVKSGQLLMAKRSAEDKQLFEKSAIELSSFLGFLLTTFYILFAILLFSWTEDICEDAKRQELYEDDIWIPGPRGRRVEERARNDTSPTVTSTSESIVET